MKHLSLSIKPLSAIFIIIFFSQLSYSQTFFPINAANNGVFEALPSGGSVIQDFDCVDANPCYWFNVGGQSVTVEFFNPQNEPSVRVWGMNDDDTGSIMVNGINYDLSASTAVYSDKVICSEVWGSPGPDGIFFQSGGIIGANTNSEGNWSYQDITLLTTGIESITVTSNGGAGWGVSGVTVEITNDLIELAMLDEVMLYPNPVIDRLYFDLYELDVTELRIYDIQGALQIQKTVLDNLTVLDLNSIAKGIYFVEIRSQKHSATQRFVKL